MAPSAVHAASLDAYGKLPSLEFPVISPDGSRIAFVRRDDQYNLVMVQSLGSQEPAKGINLHDAKVRELDWADDTHLLITASKTTTITDVIAPREEWAVVQSFDVMSGHQDQVLDGAPDALNISYESPRVRIMGGSTRVFLEGMHFINGRGRTTLFSADPGGGHVRLADGQSVDADGWLVDAAGNVVAEYGYGESDRHWSLKIKRDGRWTESYGVDTPIDTPVVDGLSPDGSAVVFHDEQSDGYRIAPLDGSPVHEVPLETYGAGELLVDPTNDRIIGALRTTMHYNYNFVSRETQTRWDAILRAYPKADVRLVTWTPGWSKVVIEVTGPGYGDEFSLVDFTTRHAVRIGSVYADIGPDDYAETRAIAYRTADGLEIPAILTLPRGHEAKGLPLVVLPHGGPAARDDPGFDWWAQGLASRGYAVLQPQFRGSDGFGVQLLEAGYGQFGRKMQTDLSDGVRKLAADGIVDPKRVCIVGASYGGYAALAGAAFDPGVYRCAVSAAGLSDLSAFLSWQQSRLRRSDAQGIRYWDRYFGAASPDDAVLGAISPAMHADAIKIPILLIHGRDDTRVPFKQSEIMQDALLAAKKPVRLVELEAEDHFLSRSATRLQMLKETVAFLTLYNPPN